MIEYLSLKRITAMHADEIQEAVCRTIDSGWYLQGQAVRQFEQEYAAYTGTRHCVSCANGLDAITLILRAYIELGVLQPGDEVIVPANTYIATILSITENRLKPILMEPCLETLQIDDSCIEEAITAKTRAMMLVNLYGKNAYTERIGKICQQHDLLLIEDCAQSHGIRVEGDAQAHSFYPGKNLGALGDAGAVTTDDDRLAAVIRALANYGSSRKYVFPYRGRNSRMDELQAAVLSVKLKYLDDDNARRKAIAAYYDAHINHPDIHLPDGLTSDCVYHIYPVLCERRDELMAYLKEKGIETIIHYPIPPHHQNCYKEWRDISLPVTELIHQRELSLPCNQAMTQDEVEYVVQTMNAFPPNV
jgi:dTDP-4-amino-4,6-dideoxygalactose transaminase